MISPSQNNTATPHAHDHDDYVETPRLSASSSGPQNSVENHEHADVDDEDSKECIDWGSVITRAAIVRVAHDMVRSPMRDATRASLSPSGNDLHSPASPSLGLALAQDGATQLLSHSRDDLHSHSRTLRARTPTRTRTHSHSHASKEPRTPTLTGTLTPTPTRTVAP
ncbi:hypothetical protein B0H16DRAFT_1740981 [Mycena metata]|uniref:Uncharacterized protein n=1 Tax=Mycena metata TaxID=1033252 RepID=A0AAD7HB58_9AGAR|nr:hypothetical protein B0H16DRAFT_1740981 [Mycena metata]